MPLYEFQCPKCAEVAEVMQSYDAPPPSPCPKCGAKGPMQRLISRTSFQLKGGGWYADLYSSGGKKEELATEEKKASDDSREKLKGKRVVIPDRAEAAKKKAKPKAKRAPAKKATKAKATSKASAKTKRATPASKAKKAAVTKVAKKKATGTKAAKPAATKRKAKSQR